MGGFWTRKGNWRRDRRGGKIYTVTRKTRAKKMEPELPCPCADARAADQSHATMACEPGTGKNGNIILLTLGRGI